MLDETEISIADEVDELLGDDVEDVEENETGIQRAQLDVYLGEQGVLLDVLLDGASVYPTWFKLEFKGNGEMSAKVRGVRLSTRLGDKIVIHTEPR